MKKQEQLKVVSISYVISIIVTFILSYLKKKNCDLDSVISAIRVSTILTFWWWFYFEKGWKIPIVNKMLYRINLNGTWYGTYKSADSNTGKINKGDIVIRIKQSFLNISVISYTKNYTNYSHSEEVKYDEKTGINGLIYVYSQKENSPLDLAERNGTAELQVSKNDCTYKLEGEFWTILGTKGKLNLVRVSKKIVNSFELGEKLHKDFKNTK